MYTHNNSEVNNHFFYSFPENIEQALDVSEEVQQNISEIINFHYVCSIERANSYIQIGNLFKDVYWKTLGYSSCHEIMNNMECYQKLLKHSITVYDTLTPLFVLSFKHHLTALHYFEMNGQQDKAILAMSETGKLAKIIAHEYETLSQKFVSLIEKITPIMLVLSIDRDKLSQLEMKKCADKLELNSLDNAVNLTSQIQTGLINFSYFLSDVGNNSVSLTNPNLAKASYVKLVKTSTDVSQTSLFKDLFLPLTEGAKHIEKKIECNKITSIYNFTLRTVDERLADNSPSKEAVKYLSMLINPSFAGLKIQLENSYLKWLTLVKINQAMLIHTTIAIDEVEEETRFCDYKKIH